MKVLSRLDLRSAGRAYVLARNQRLDPAIVDTQGSDVDIVLGSTAEVSSLLSTQIAVQFGAHLLETAEGDDLDRWARSEQQAFRKGAAPALVTLRASRPTATAGAGAVAVGKKVLARGGAEYRLTTQLTFGGSDLTASCEAAAVQAGKESQVGKNQVVKFSNPSADVFDPSISITNPEAAAGGEPREEDDVFRERLRKLIKGRNAGTFAAIEAGALAVPGVFSALAVEAYGPVFYELGTFRSLGVTLPMPARAVVLYVADSSGVANAALARAASLGLGESRAAGISVAVLAGLPTIVAVRLKLAFTAGVDTAALAELVRRAVVEFVNTLSVGETLERGALLALLRRYKSSGLVTGEGSVVEPAGDVVPAPGETIRTRAESVTLE